MKGYIEQKTLPFSFAISLVGGYTVHSDIKAALERRLIKYEKLLI